MLELARLGHRLPEAHRREIEVLAARYGAPRIDVADLGANRFADPGGGTPRPCEVCMIIRRSSARFLVFRKTFYPPEIFRLPTGGIGNGEGILDALGRELYEETGFSIGGVHFLSVVAYRTSAGVADPLTFTYAFLLDSPEANPRPVDPHEHVEAFREIDPHDLRRIAWELDRLAPQPAPELESNWSDWGRFRAVVHRIVWEMFKDSPFE
ncbi:MAG TPA: NUDIX hydrolase [bacterium]|jgi:8-oxo-dGTP pyrophosphatase MutT (NUDIX family)|nr:NUDIX hydrolase [bacterium]